MKYLLSSAALLLLEAAGVNAFWRMQCGSPLIVDRIDPLVQPDVSPAKHLHNIMGGSAFDKTTSFAQLQESTCTSCQVKGDKSIYWVPALYFEHEGGKLELVRQKDGMLVYYIPEYGDNVEMFPEGFAMLAGDPNKRKSANGTPGTEKFFREDAIGFNCLNYDTTPEGFANHHEMPDKEFMKKCKDGLRADITFPSCWNGEKDSSDHRSHMAYPQGTEGPGACPDTHQRRLITIKFETIFDVSQFSDSAGRFVWSTGDLTGYGYHGDFVNGWNSELLKAAYNDGTCVKTRAADGSGGVITDCRTFVDRGELQDMSTMNNCKRTSITGEDYTGQFNKLPGCNPVGNEGSAFDCGEDNVVGVVANAVNNKPATTPKATTTTPSTTMTTKAKPTTTPKVEMAPAAVEEKPETIANPPIAVTTSAPPKKIKEVVVTVVETIYQTVWHDVVETATTYVPAAATSTPAAYRRRHRHRRHN